MNKSIFCEKIKVMVNFKKKNDKNLGISIENKQQFYNASKTDKL